MNNAYDHLLGKSGKHVIGYFKSRKDELRNITEFLSPDASLSERAYCVMRGINEAPTCVCGRPLVFHKFNKGYFKTCGLDQCVKSARVGAISGTMMERYGTHASKMESTKAKTKATLMERYGDENYVNAGARSTTMNDMYGADFALKLDAFIDKKKQTQKLRYGDENYNNRDQIVATNMERYGRPTPFSEDIRERARSAFSVTVLNRINSRDFLVEQSITVLSSERGVYRATCGRCRSSFWMKNGPFNSHIRMRLDPCPCCRPPMPVYSSAMELDLLRQVEGMGVAVEHRYRGFGGREVDLYLPDYGLGIEFNGLYWHSELHRDSGYHVNKKLALAKFGVDLIHIYEDDWLERRDVVLSIISNRVGRSHRIHARRCTVRSLSPSESRAFLEENHIQGDLNGVSVRLGLFFEGELVSCMTFCKMRRVTGNKSSAPGSYELARFCNKKYHSVVGGASKLFSHFVKGSRPDEVVSYASFDRSNGGLYESLGFVLERRSPPNYWYVVGRSRVSRYEFRKDRLVSMGADTSASERDIMASARIYRVFDSGSLVYRWSGGPKLGLPGA
jgi:hypothetical protein